MVDETADIGRFEAASSTEAGSWPAKPRSGGVNFVNTLANGMLLYVLFVILYRLFVIEQPPTVTLGGYVIVFPHFLSDSIFTFVASGLSAFAVLAGVRLGLRRLRLRLSTTENAATTVFLVLVLLCTLHDFAQDVLLWLETGESGLTSFIHLLAVAGAVTGVALRRRVAL